MLESNTIAGFGIARIIEYAERVTDSPKLNVICSLRVEKVHISSSFLFLPLPRRGPLKVLFSYTCSKMLSFHSLTKIIKKEAYVSSKAALRLNIHGEVDRDLNTVGIPGGSDVKAISNPRFNCSRLIMWIC